MTLETEKIISWIDNQQTAWQRVILDVDDKLQKQLLSERWNALQLVKEMIERASLIQSEMVSQRKFQPTFDNIEVQSIEENHKYEIYIMASGNAALHPKVPSDLAAALGYMGTLRPQRVWIKTELHGQPTLINWDDL